MLSCAQLLPVGFGVDVVRGFSGSVFVAGRLDGLGVLSQAAESCLGRDLSEDWDLCLSLDALCELRSELRWRFLPLEQELWWGEISSISMPLLKSICGVSGSGVGLVDSRPTERSDSFTFRRIHRF